MLRKLLLAAALAVPLVAVAAPSKFAVIDTSSEEELLKGAKALGFRVEGKVKGPAKKVAITGFQVRYNFQSAMGVKVKSTYIPGGFTEITTRRVWAEMNLTTEQYRALTDVFYRQFEAYLASRGFEVIDREAVLGSAAYQAIEAGEEKEKDDWARDAPTGFKTLPMYLGQPTTGRSKMAAVTKEVGADASVAVALNLGVCAFEGEKKWRPGITEQRLCIVGPPGVQNAQIPGLNIEWYGGAEQGKKDVDEVWHARAYKYHMVWEDKKIGAVYDTPVVVSDADIAAYQPKAITDGLEPGLDVFAVEAQAVLDRALTAMFSVWDDKNG